jgi:hypothetical protein
MQAACGRLIGAGIVVVLLIVSQSANARSIHERLANVTLASFAADRTEVLAGDSVVLSWATLNLKNCVASGGWSGKQPTTGSYRTPALNNSATFTLSCKARHQTVTRAVSVTVTQPPAEPEQTATTETPTEPEQTATTETPTEPEQTASTEPPPEATLQLSADTKELRPGESTTLRWNGAYVSNCQASGSWSGPRGEDGSQNTGSLSSDSTYTLTCDSAQGTLVAVTSVLVTAGGTTISWQPPTENVDGSPLDDLQQYRIYVGSSPQSYDQQIEVTDPRANSQFVALERGEYHVAMTAVDRDGNESGYSNEVVKTVQ